MVVSDLLVLEEKAKLKVAPLEKTKGPRWVAMKEIAKLGALSMRVRDPEAPPVLYLIVHK